MMVVLWNAGHIIRAMHNIDPQLADKAVGYLRALLWGAPGYLFFQVARNQCEGLAKTKPGMVMGFLGLLVNIPVNYIFIYGHFGMPELGGVGCGVATGSRLLGHVLLDDALVREARPLACAIFVTPGRRSRRPRLGGAEALDRHRHAGGAGAVL